MFGKTVLPFSWLAIDVSCSMCNVVGSYDISHACRSALSPHKLLYSADVLRRDKETSFETTVSYEQDVGVPVTWL